MRIDTDWKFPRRSEVERGGGRKDEGGWGRPSFGVWDLPKKSNFEGFRFGVVLILSWGLVSINLYTYTCPCLTQHIMQEFKEKENKP